MLMAMIIQIMIKILTCDITGDPYEIKSTLI